MIQRLHLIFNCTFLLSGKTTTLIESSKLIKNKRILFCAFNKHIEQEIKKKVNSVQVKTIHSIGFKCIVNRTNGNLNVEQRKYSDFIRRDFWGMIETDLQPLFEDLHPEEKKLKKTKIFQDLENLIRLVRLTLTNPTSNQEMQLMIEHYRLESPYIDILLFYLSAILERGKDIAETENIIDFDDMVWLPNQWNLTPFQHDWIFVDEAQDLSKASLDLILKSRKKNGRIIFVGDKSQAIYGFSGADSKSIDNIKEMTKAQYFPLSICYRCPKSHMEKAKSIVPYIEASPYAKEGFIKTIPEYNLLDLIKVNDMVICRLSAPLVKTCIDLIGLRIPAVIKGQDIAARILSIISEIELVKDFSYSRFRLFLTAYLNEEINKFKKKGSSEILVENLRDSCRAIFICYQNFKKAKSANDLKREIMLLFQESQEKV